MEVTVDTHALVWYLTGDKRLGKTAKKFLDTLDTSENKLIISVVVLMEVLVMFEKKRVNFTWEEFEGKISQFPNTIIYPIGLDVLEKMRSIRNKLELHDRIIVATAQLHSGHLISKDSEIVKVNEINVIW